jgi:hypothetical protein
MEYETLWILLQTKALNVFDLTDLKELLEAEDHTDWKFTIDWLHSLPDLPVKPCPRMTPEDYQKNSLG